MRRRFAIWLAKFYTAKMTSCRTTIMPFGDGEYTTNFHIDYKCQGGTIHVWFRLSMFMTASKFKEHYQGLIDNQVPIKIRTIANLGKADATYWDYKVNYRFDYENW